MSRFLQLTFHKCGSQWVRDVLTASEVERESGIRLSPGGGVILHISSGWPNQHDGTFLGPIYNASFTDWLRHRKEADKAVIVIRDPRDLIVSLINSSMYSHVLGNGLYFPLLRQPLLRLNNRDRIVVGIFAFRTVSFSFSSWSTVSPSANEYITSYESLIENNQSEFSKIVKFFGWKVSQETLAKVVQRLSFRARSGRGSGVEEQYSHYRKGVRGDWKRYFDRSTGKLFEETFPRLLKCLAYENDEVWYEQLPETAAVEQRKPVGRQEAIDIHELQAQLVRAVEEKQWLQLICDEREELIRRLETTCEERLELINKLDQVLHQRSGG
jgi:hypothetical protein